MSLEPPSLRTAVESLSTPILRTTSPSPVFNSFLMSTTIVASNHSTGPATTSSGPTAAILPLDEWNCSLSPNVAGSEAPSEELQRLGLTDGPVSEVDPQILEALRSKDRLYVLKLGEMMEGLINERKARIDLVPSTSYQRLLVHRCCTFYKLSPETEVSTKTIIVTATIDSKIPSRRICELVPAESTAQPAFKIMRRTANERNRSKADSQGGSVAGDDADLSDVEPSEAGSLGGRSNASKKRMTIEEREAAYNKARSRIFMDFQEKQKEKDMSASSSTQSLASTSGRGRSSSMDDYEDSVGTPATESEWSGPVTRGAKDVRYAPGIPSGPSSRSLRSNAPAFNAGGSGASRDSRSSSPSFTYASLYEPPPTISHYDPNQAAGKQPAPFAHQQYGYPYGQPQVQPAQGQQPYPPPWQHLSGYPYNPLSPMPTSDPMAQAGQDVYMQPQQHPAPQYVSYPNPYLWPHAHPPPPGSIPMQHPQTPSHHQQMPNQTHVPTPPQSAPPYVTPYMHSPSPYGPYPIPGYYPPPGQQVPHHHAVMNQILYSQEQRHMNGLTGDVRNGNHASNHSRTSSRNSNGQGSVNGGNRRGAPPARSAWSYGPGISNGGFGYGNPSAFGGGAGGGEAVGPRLSSAIRRASQTSSVGSGSAGNRTPAGDEASSTASSSTTSSSSRRTYTSTASSQHPLPARPDWAVGLKPQPTLRSSHGRQHDMGSSRGSPARNGHQSLQSASQQLPVILQSTDFPPLTSLASPPPEKRSPAVGGAWTNASSTRSILMPSQGHMNTQSGQLFNNSHNGRLEEPDRGFERPPPKVNAELFNPKTARRPGSGHNSLPQETDRQAGSDAMAGMLEQVTSLSVVDTSPNSLTVVKGTAVAT